MERTMTSSVCLVPAPTIGYPRGGGHFWEYLNWALALRDLGYRVIWLEGVDLDEGDNSTARRRRWRGSDPRECVEILKTRLAAYGLPDALSLFSMSGGTVPADVAQGCLDLDAAAAAGVLLNTWHSLPAHVVRRFRQKIFVDTDPGLVQVLMTTGDIHLAPHAADGREPGAGDLSGCALRGMARAPRAAGVEHSRSVGRERDARPVPGLSAAFERGVQLRQGLLSAVRQQLDQ